MENYRLIRPEHLNHYGYLFGGYLLKWVDEVAWLEASLDYPDCRFVTVGMDRVAFKKPVKEGTILQFVGQRTREGATSVEYSVNVNDRESQIFSTHVTLVRVGEDGNKLALPD